MSLKDPYQDIEFSVRHALILDKDGTPIYENDVTFPTYFSDNAVNIVSSKYFYSSDDRKETDIRQMFDRVSDTLTDWGVKQKYFGKKDSNKSKEFNYRLKKYQIQQLFAFNSPVYFNVGNTDKVQASACFIIDVQDDMESIANVCVVESKIFKNGSGSGMNISNIRSKYEHVGNTRGYASGPISFLKVHDVLANVIRSGGSLRRSAKLVCLDIQHPDIEEFIDCKKFEDEKIKALINGDIESRKGCELSDEVFFQNTNISVRIPDKFMKKVLDNDTWDTKFVTDDKTYKTYLAQDLLVRIAERAWECADPGLQFSDSINNWNTCSNDGEIRSSNPCGEFFWLDHSSCNLASLNLLKFVKYDPETNEYTFDFELFKDVVSTVITAQDIIIDKAVYPTEEITTNTKSYRPLGLGYTNLGAMLMYLGLPYDSDAGRSIVSHITAILTGTAFITSYELSKIKEPFKHFESNKESYYKVLKKHNSEVLKIKKVVENDVIYSSYNKFSESLSKTSGKIWETIMELVEQEETFRNAQVTLMAPTGTISFLMDAQTTGVEPEFSHVKYKRLSNTDGSILTTISPLTRTCLENLKYDRDKINEIEYYIKENKPLNKCKSIDKSHTSIFDVSSCSHEDQLISYTGHIKMLAAIQPFISGGISKTINLPNNATVEDVFKCYLECWKMGLKGVTVYRDGSKNYQPLSNKEDDENINRELELPEIMTLEDMKQNERLIKHLHAKLAERKLPPERPAMIYKFNVGGVKGFLTCGLYDDGDLGEIFINISKEGSTLSGLLDCLATAVSISLQSGVPLKDFVEKMIWQKFEPYGFTTDKDIKTATSLVDFIFKYLGMKFLNKNDQIELGLITQEDVSINKQSESFEEVDINNEEVKNDFNNRSLLNTFAGPSCNNCGSIMIKKGNCFLCMNCGSNNGACG